MMIDLLKNRDFVLSLLIGLVIWLIFRFGIVRGLRNLQKRIKLGDYYYEQRVQREKDEREQRRKKRISRIKNISNREKKEINTSALDGLSYYDFIIKISEDLNIDRKLAEKVAELVAYPQPHDEMLSKIRGMYNIFKESYVSPLSKYMGVVRFLTKKNVITEEDEKDLLKYY